MSSIASQGKSRPQLWNGSAWVDAPGDATNGAKVQGTVAVSNFPATQPVSLATAPTTPVTGTFWQATQPVSLASAPTTAVTGPLTDTQLRATAVPVSGSFFPATQPVSLASAPTTPVTGTFWQATQPVSLASTVTTDVSDRAARVLGVTSQASPNLVVTATAATGVAATATLPAVAAQFHYITLIEIQLYATAARTGGVTPVLVTTTNLNTNPVWDFDSAQAVGVTIRQASQFVPPLKSSAVNTATTIAAPIATTGIWRINAYYYTAA